MSAPPRPRIGFVGFGRLAASAAAAIERAGYEVTAAASRDPAFRERLPAGVQAVSAEVVVERCELVFLTVPDSTINGLAAGLRWRPGQYAVHCSGALGLDVLAAATDAGAIAGCLHPLQSFPSRDPEPDRFTGIYCGVEAEEPLRDVLDTLVGSIGARPLRLDGVDHALYHAAAVFASNYAIALMNAAGRAWTMAGLPAAAARPALAPLLLSVAQNVDRTELEDALTGPIARGDAGTVAGHIAALAADPALDTLYRVLANELLDIAPALSEEARTGLRAAITDRRPGPP